MRAGGKAAVALALFASTASCKPAAPSAWAQGGAYLEIPRARWVYGNLLVELDWDGKVRIGGEHALSLDRAGRVFTPGGAPIAILLPTGQLVGTADDPLGTVGAATAARAGEHAAWLQLFDTGEVARFRDGGGALPFGVWIGCAELRSRQACTLVTHVIALGHREVARDAPPVSIGIGVGAGMWH
ncbi:MAG: hypothetical protein IT373_30890 [Polyangiaceae bacterium]|nr:hypothetical protein [Polyangiaceae bacterium]